jgi:hypothetical protein
MQRISLIGLNKKFPLLRIVELVLYLKTCYGSKKILRCLNYECIIEESEYGIIEVHIIVNK